MSLRQEVAASPFFEELDKNGQAETILWAMSKETPFARGVSIPELSEGFEELGFSRPNSTRVREHFRRSKNIRSVGDGRYLPTRPFDQAMSGRYPTTTVASLVPSALEGLPLPPFVSDVQRADLERMLPVYCQLFLLENSMRGLIEKVLRDHLGSGWWERAASEPMKRKEAERLEKERVKKWAPARSDLGPLFSLDWSDLITLMRKHEQWFKPYIGEVDFLHRYNDAAMFRHVVAHNGALRDDDDLTLIAIDYRTWIKQLSGVANAA